MKFTKLEKSWIMYDWANSVYATIMVAAVFPIYFTGVCGSEGDFWWGIGTSIATTIMAVAAPFVGAVADYKGLKKKLLAGFLALGLVFVGLSALTDTWQVMLIGYIFSHIGFSGSVLIYDSFLTDVTTPERMDAVSSYGFAFGYIGGSTIPFLASILLISLGSNFGVDSVMAVKLSLWLTVLWWGVFSIPILKNGQQRFGSDAPAAHPIKTTLLSVWSTIRNIIRNKKILFFVVAYFFYIDGVNTVINMATAYGATLGLDSTGMILALMVTQLVAFPCAILFGKLSARTGSLTMIFAAILIYIGICCLGFFMGFGLEEGILNVQQASAIFWVLAVLVGTVQGGIQAISRSYYGKLVPPEASGEYFGFFDIFGKFAAVLGPSLYALIKAVTGRSSFSILSIVVLFLLGLLPLTLGRKYLNDKN
ncbi:MAG: MFS transporter [Clostridiales bacterium]|jgi:UMF1 family MFS transporter|nr:MFS transporter [Clostridiales bacterium]